MSYWYSPDEDPFTQVGYVRLIVIRHNPGYNYRGQRDNCTQVMNIQAFQIGFVSPEINKSRYNSGPSLGWMDEEIGSSCEHKINHLFKNLPNGVYELIGDMYHWSSQSYEGEWDGDSELRNTKIQAISFDHAMHFGCEEMYNEMRALIPHSENRGNYYSNETDVHPFMTKQQILVNQANALNICMSGYGNRTNYKDMKVEDLENCIHMLMLQIDSEHQKMQPKSLEIDEMIKSCLDSHRDLMDTES